MPRAASRRKAPTPTPQPSSSKASQRTRAKVPESPRRSARLHVPDDEVIRPTTRTPTRKKRLPNAEQQVDGTASGQARGANPLKKGRKSGTTLNLPPVTETEPEDPGTIADDEDAMNEDGQEEEEDGDSSTPTSHSVELVARLQEKSDELLEHLLDLSHETVGMLRLLLPRTSQQMDAEGLRAEIESSMEQLKIADSAHSRRLHDREIRFDDMIRRYDDYYFIDHSVVIRALFQKQSMKHVPWGPWRPDEIFYDANLAILARDVLTLQPISISAFDKIQQIDNVFPTPYLASLSVSGDSSSMTGLGSSLLVEESLKLAISFRTQLAILQFQINGAGEDGLPVLKQIFYKSEDPRKLKGWSSTVLDPDWGIMRKEVKKALSAQVQDIMESFLDDGVDIEELEAKYPWSEFVVEVMDWIRHRHDEITLKIKEHGGTENIYNQLRAVLAEKDVTDATAVPEGHRRRTVDFTKGSSESYKYLNMKRKRLSGTLGAIDGNARLEADDDMGGVAGEEGIVAGQSSARKKAGAMYERQANARKLPEVRLSPDPSQDVGFRHRTDGRPIARENSGVPAESSVSPNKRRKTGGRVGEGEMEAEYAPLAESARDGDEVSDIPPSTQAARTYLETQRQNKLARRQERSLASRPQSRRQWSVIEVQALLDLIEDVGCRWTVVKETDEAGDKVLTGRDQTAIKDKARNMKYDYLAAGVPLPTNFEKIQLDQKLIDKLTDQGIDYEQRRMRVRRVVEVAAE